MCAGLLQLGQLDAKRARKPGRAAKSQPSGLAGLKTTELIARGTAAGFSEESLAAALDTHPPKHDEHALEWRGAQTNSNRRFTRQS